MAFLNWISSHFRKQPETPSIILTAKVVRHSSVDGDPMLWLEIRHQEFRTQLSIRVPERAFAAFPEGTWVQGELKKVDLPC